MIQSLYDSVGGFLAAESTGSSPCLSLLDMLQRFLKIHVESGNEGRDRAQALSDMMAQLKIGDVALLHIRHQNAGLLLTVREDGILFEAFELLAQNQGVMSCAGALLREFPDRAALVAFNTIRNPDLLRVLVDSIQKLDAIVAPLTRPKTTKAGTDQPEERDTISPILVTGMLIDILAGLGKEVEPQQLIKRSREQVGWNQGLLPFHRSPTWLLLRVALRAVLDRYAVPNAGQGSWYKQLMAYHHGRILDIALRPTASISSDTLFSMMAKVARRVVKLDLSEDIPWLEETKATVSQGRRLLEGQWKTEENTSVLPLNKLSGLAFHQDTGLELANLKQHFAWIRSRPVGTRDPMGPGDTTQIYSFESSDLPYFETDGNKDITMVWPELLQVEAWVELSLQNWVTGQLSLGASGPDYSTLAEGQLERLRVLMAAYHKRASEAYNGIPEALSVMYLAIMELWVATDKLAAKLTPLLLYYDPGFPPDLFHPLLLERSTDMRRVKNLECYLSQRRQRATARRTTYPSAFSGFGADGSFAVRYFLISPAHQDLHQSITERATRMKREKLEEYERKKASHKSLTEQRNQTNHQQRVTDEWGNVDCVPDCCKCRLQTKMDNLKIDIFEWPLPSDIDHAKAAVVEISLPVVVKIWRDATWKLVTEVFRNSRKDHGGGQLYFLKGYRGLAHVPKVTSRVHPASTIKPMMVTHYDHPRHISEATADNICVPHAASYTYYDQDFHLVAENQIPGARIPQHCSFVGIVKGLPTEIQKWVRDSEHTSNDVIAGQSNCPFDYKLEEFRAFGNLRSGVALQWANMLSQHVIPSIDPNKPQTFALIAQASLEVGPDDKFSGDSVSIWRDAHRDTQNETFMAGILRAMNEALDRVRESWQNQTALALLACLCTRLLSLSPSVDMSNEFLKYLGRVRCVAIDWADTLSDKLDATDVDRDREEWMQRLLMAALICAATFNVGKKHLESVLKTSKELAVFVRSVVLARNYLPPSGRPSDPIALQLVHRWYVAMYQARDFVVEQVINKGNPGLDEAIKSFWTDYLPPTPPWMPRVLASQKHIFERSDQRLATTFNLLTGNLFVNGYPLSKLPLAYKTHPTFRQLFGDRVLEVGPSSHPGMEFSACHVLEGWVVHFRMTDNKLVVRSVRDGPSTPDVWEYIPAAQLQGDLPNSFVNHYAHWLNHLTSELEFRPIRQKWVSSPDNWRLVQEGDRHVLKKDSRFVIDVSSPTAKLVHTALGSFETRLDVDAIFDSDTRSLGIELPRLSLSFSLQQGTNTIKSEDYMGMEIDKTQSIGTLVGLSDKLVLRHSRGLGFRTVLVPRGELSSQHTSRHVKISILRPNDNHVQHDSFIVDDKLGRLADTGSLSSKLYLCWLHALTSHCLPDPLTGRTGTEEALRTLEGAAIKSYPKLDDKSRGILVQIAKLSPHRQYYPDYLQVMEQTTWNDDMPPLSQHDSFWSLASSIYTSYQMSEQLFQLEVSGEHKASAARVFGSPMSPTLELRAKARNAIFRVSGFGAEEHSTAHDKWYRPSNRPANGSASSRAYVAQFARCVETSGQGLIFDPSKALAEAIVAINGKEFTGVPTVDLAFDLQLLGPPSSSLTGLFCGLHRSLVQERSKYTKIWFLSALLYAEGSDTDFVQVLMALGNISTFSQHDMFPPSHPKFDLTVTRRNRRGVFHEIVYDARKSRDECPEGRWERRYNEESWDFENRRNQSWISSSKRMVAAFVDSLEQKIMGSWVVEAPNNRDYQSYLDIGEIMPKVQSQVEMARRTDAFHIYLNSLSSKMRQVNIRHRWNLTLPPAVNLTTIPPPSRAGFVSATSTIQTSPLVHPTELTIFAQPAPTTIGHPRPELFPQLCSVVQKSSEDDMSLSRLVDELATASDLHPYQSSYLDDLHHSMAIPDIPTAVMTVEQDDPEIKLALDRNLQDTRRQYDDIHRRLTAALTGTSTAHQLCHSAGLYPRITPLFLLQRLSRTLWAGLSNDWRKSIISLALSLIYVQRAVRLHNHGLNLTERWSDLRRELSNPGDHDSSDWNALEYPDNLLLEIEQGIMIRPTQNVIAAVMRSPPEDQNSVMQLNMGEGKSSVIVPVVAAALADGSRLVRVVVAKPQSSQMTHMLISRLGSLINRPVYYLPISRSIRLSSSDVVTLRGMLDDCQSKGGVLLVQPEQPLSLKLMGVENSWVWESAAEEKSPLGEEIVQLYQDFESVSRDIVDESDENFSVKFELIYTMGTQEPVEMSPDRWMLIQQILSVTEIAARDLLEDARKAGGVTEGLLIEDFGPGRVPVIRVLDESMGQRLIEAVATEVCKNGLKGFPIHHQTKEMRQAVLDYILRQNVSSNDISMVENPDTGLFTTATTKNAILLLRGLFANGVMLFALGQKRFRVNYGLAPDRNPPTMLAVPYRAKDMPSPRSEFSHPDVVIVLTCLSYYYRGLSDAELYTCLELLSKSDQGDEEYARWAVESPDLPQSFHHFSSINLKDRPQCEDIVFPGLRYSRPAIDFYLATVVFPKEMKQFPHKLSASGWDLAKSKEQPLTGFSGTNDSKGVLPLSVTALDLQPHTNARVLTTILQEENTVLELGSGGASQVSALTEEMLLGALAGKSTSPMRVILDVGAQIIESSNFQMAEKLLKSVPVGDIDAVIFFDDRDELAVLTRNGFVNSFLTSPFVAHTDRCLVFLDQAHTRGTDLKLPDDYRAAVTLGPGVTKDTLVQACMRMRKLGQGQSVTFIVSPEMQKRIRAIRNITNGRPLVVSDIIAWAIWETWNEEERSIPLWANQGIRHIRQETIWKDANLNNKGKFSSDHAEKYLELEAMSLKDRYQPKKPTEPTDTDVATLMSQLNIEDLNSWDEMDPSLSDQLSKIEKKVSNFADSTHGAKTGTSMLQEEQERELAPEIEQERQVFRPAPRKALRHMQHPDLLIFVQTGQVFMDRGCFLPAFDAFSKTSGASLYPAAMSTFPGDLLITKDFVQTVDESGPDYHSDRYQREVQWILVSRPSASGIDDKATTDWRMVIISPFEANEIKLVIEEQEHLVPVKLHSYLPRPSLNFRTMEDLDTYIVPDHTTGSTPGTIRETPPQKLIMQLNLFAGQSYLRSYDEYVRLCRYLGLMYTACENDDVSGGADGTSTEVRTADGFVGKRGYPGECQFDANPVPFLSEMYKKIRRDCVGGFEKTHMGRVLAGEILRERDFDGE